jgi:hypothetical protein
MGGHGWAHVMLWVGMGGHRSMLMVMVWVWVQIRRKMLGSAILFAWEATWADCVIEINFLGQTCDSSLLRGVQLASP